MPSQGPREIELKLDLDPADAADLAADLTRRFGAAAPVLLTSTYYDTPDAALRAAGVTLRVRTGGGPPVQTVKRSAAAQAGLFDRDEWERPLAGTLPDFAAFAGTPAGAALALDPARLAPAFETVVERTIWHAVTAEGRVEIALDTGLAAARGRTEQFAELELELKQGEPDHLFAVLGTLDGNGRLRPGVRTKSERGYALAAGKAPRAHKAEPLRLGRRMDAAAAFRAVAHACLRHFWLNEPLLEATRAPEALHQTRVALRRFRSALSLFRPIVADDDLDRFRGDLRDVSRHLGEARNLDVYLRSAAAASGQDTRDAVARRCEAAYDDVLARLRAKPFRDTMLALLAWIEAGPWLRSDDRAQRKRREQPVRVFAAAVLDKRRRRIKRRGRHLDALDEDARHRVRIEAKKLRYASEFFAGLCRSGKAQARRAAFTDALEALQEHLGALNDIATGQAIAASVAEAQPDCHSDDARVDAMQPAETEALLAEAAAAHARFVATKRFWRSWPR